MIAGFIVFASVFTLVAIAIVVWPLLRARKDRVHAGNTSAAPARRAPQFTRRRSAILAAVTIGLLLPAAAAALYLAVGAPGSLRNISLEHARNHPGDDLDAMIKALSARLRENPDDASGWLLLARSYNARKQPAKALHAYSRAAKQRPDDAGLLVEYANATALASHHQFTDAAQKLIARALALEPDNRNALALAGAAALRAGDNAAALRYWTQLKDQLPAGSPELSRAEGLIALAKGGPAPDPGIRGTVTLAPELAARIRPYDTVFVFARAMDGSSMPLAVKRIPVGTWPLEFVLDDKDAMTTRSRLSQHRLVTVVARISHSGSARAVPGDLQGAAHHVALGARNVTISIDHEIGG